MNVQDVVVESSLGALRGVRLEHVVRFCGVPYGADTGGSRRFLPPLPAQPWTGVRSALVYGPAAPQPRDRRSSMRPHQETLWGKQEPLYDQREDCLVMNIWSAGLDGSDRPVIVWLHGGNFMYGSGALNWYDGAALARRGNAVIIT